MSKVLSFLNRNLTKIIWVFAILIWVGVGIYYFSTKTTEISEKTILQPSPAEILTTPTPYLLPTIPPGTPTIEGIITRTAPGQFDLQSGEQTFTFFLDQDSLFTFPEESEGVVVGEGMRVFYREKDDKLYVIKGVGGIKLK